MTSPPLSNLPVYIPLTGTPGYLLWNCAALRARTKNCPGASELPLVKVKVMPSEKKRPLKSSVFRPAFFSSRNSSSSPLTRPTAGGLYINSETNSFVKSCWTKIVVSTSALRLGPSFIPVRVKQHRFEGGGGGVR